MTCLDRERSTVSMRLSFLLGWDAELTAQPREGTVVAEVGEVKAANAGERERVPRLLETRAAYAASAWSSACSIPRDRLLRARRCRGPSVHEATALVRPARARSSAGAPRVAVSPCASKRRDERLEAVGVVADLELEEAGAGARSSSRRVDAGGRAAGRAGFSTAPTKQARAAARSCARTGTCPARGRSRR